MSNAQTTTTTFGCPDCDGTGKPIDAETDDGNGDCTTCCGTGTLVLATVEE